MEAALEIGLAPEVIVRFISFRWIIPCDGQAQLLDEEDLARARLIWELQQEFGVNDEAIPIILKLIDQLNRMHYLGQKEFENE
ncbi:MAG: hypothetical protein HQK50_18810 [Oligoflexia bacterium]|nr:hypothetical protein [Oligoflexia bacterium]MBF0367633.1 hypothetical protein [Oligoflexia bacterium]